MVDGAIENQVVRVSFICYLSVFFFFYNQNQTWPSDFRFTFQIFLLVYTIYKIYTFNSIYAKQSYVFVILILTVIGGKMKLPCRRQIFNSLLWHKKYTVILRELFEIKRKAK